MNRIEKVMTRRSSHFKLAVAVLVLVLVLWAAGSAIQSLWIAPLVIVVLWVVIQLGLGYRHRRHGA
jgi:fatty acid desaturase